MRLVLISLLSVFLAVSATADLVIPQTSAPRILIPVAGDAPGANGTYFRSDVTLVNFRNAEQRVLLRWYPRGRSGSSEDILTRTITLAPLSGITSENFVRNILNQTGTGGVDIIGIHTDGSTDNDARLHVTSRIWTPQPNVPNGTMSQTFPGVVFGSVLNPIKWIVGARRSEQYRLNVGVVNPSSTPQTFVVTAVTSTGARESMTLEVHGQSMAQEPMFGTSEVLQIIVQNVSPQQSTTWQAWSSSVDNVTGDAWSQLAFPAPSGQ